MNLLLRFIIWIFSDEWFESRVESSKIHDSLKIHKSSKINESLKIHESIRFINPLKFIYLLGFMNLKKWSPNYLVYPIPPTTCPYNLPVNCIVQEVSKACIVWLDHVGCYAKKKNNKKNSSFMNFRDLWILRVSCIPRDSLIFLDIENFWNSWIF